MSNKIIWIIVVVLILVGIYFWSQPVATVAPVTGEGPVAPRLSPGGAPVAPVTGAPVAPTTKSISPTNGPVLK